MTESTSIIDGEVELIRQPQIISSWVGGVFYAEEISAFLGRLARAEATIEVSDKQYKFKSFEEFLKRNGHKIRHLNLSISLPFSGVLNFSIGRKSVRVWTLDQTPYRKFVDELMLIIRDSGAKKNDRSAYISVLACVALLACPLFLFRWLAGSYDVGNGLDARLLVSAALLPLAWLTYVNGVFRPRAIILQQTRKEHEKERSDFLHDMAWRVALLIAGVALGSAVTYFARAQP